MRGMKSFGSRKIIGVVLHLSGIGVVFAAVGTRCVEGLVYCVGFGLMAVGATMAELTPD
jgi:hypothetical protein